MTLLDIFLPYQKSFFYNQSKRKIWVSSRQIGKSFCIAGILVYKALSVKNGLSLCVSVNSRSASEIIRKCSQFAEAVKRLSNGSIDYESSYDHINFSNGSRVLSLPSTSDSLRGFTAQGCVCIDEAAFIYKLDEILQGIAPTLTRCPDAELIMTTTPAGMNGTFYELYQNAIINPEWYVQHTTIHDAISDGLEIDISRLKSLCPDPDIFAQEYECKFLSEYGSMIDINLLDWYDELPSGRQTTYLGMDIGSSNDRSAIVTAIQISDITYIDDIIMLNKTTYQEQLNILKQIHKMRNFSSGYVDRTGIGSAFAEFATKQVSSRIQGWNFTSTNKTPMYERLRSMVYDHKVKFNSKFRKLIEQDFRNVQRIITPDGNVKYVAEHDQNGHSDATSGIVLALQAAFDRPASLTSPIPYSIPSRFRM